MKASVPAQLVRQPALKLPSLLQQVLRLQFPQLVPQFRLPQLPLVVQLVSAAVEWV